MEINLKKKVALLLVNDQEIKDQLFNKGLKHYRANEFFEAHEVWEDLWSDFFLEDKKFIQALIQLSVSSVSYTHLTLPTICSV